MSTTTELTLDGTTYVIIPKADFLKLQAGQPATVDAEAYARASIARDLRAAREAAGLTQAELAEKLGKSQTMIARAEARAVTVGARYVAAVLKACGLPENWKPTATIARKLRR